MDNLSFNIQENFQDNSVDFAEGQNNASSLGAITPLITSGNPDFNHKAPTLWNYLGIDNLNSLQTECAFKCVDEGLKCTSECGDFDKKCNYTCAREGLNCIRECMELRPTVMVEEELIEEEEAIVEEEIKADRLARKKMLVTSYDLSHRQYAPFMATRGDSFRINTEYGIYPNLADRTLSEAERKLELEQLQNEMR
tara:strand:+ start:323 stop:910 length:588 start_codon:yes stop_codon:yes gene_type:complete